MKCMQKILKIGGNILFWFVIIALVLVTVITMYARIGGNGQKLIGGIGFGRVVTPSMDHDRDDGTPDIPVGSFILIRQTDTQNLNVGDIILFYSDDPDVPGGMPVSHQIIRNESDDHGRPVFITKGTANLLEDAYPVYSENIIGKVVWWSLPIGKLIGFTQTSFVYPILIVLLGISLIQSAVDVVKQLIFYNKQEQDSE